MKPSPLFKTLETLKVEEWIPEVPLHFTESRESRMLKEYNGWLILVSSVSF